MTSQEWRWAEGSALTAALAAELTKARRASGLTQEAVARQMGSYQSFLSKVEAGKVSPRMGWIESYARVVGVRLVWRIEPVTNEPGPEAEPDDSLAAPCPYCGHHTLYRPEGWIEGGPVMCANPACESNHPAVARTDGPPTAKPEAYALGPWDRGGP